MAIKFNRLDESGKVIGRGTVPWLENFEALKAQGLPGEYVLGDRPMDIPPAPILPEPVLDPDMVSMEELADAVIKLAAGDKSAVDSIAAKRRRALKRMDDGGADKGHTVQRPAGRNEAASKRRLSVQSSR